MGKTRDDEIYEHGVADGKDGNLLDDLSHTFARVIPGRDSEIYDKGYTYGAKHRHDSSDDNSSESGKGGCFLSSACIEACGLPDDCAELSTLRDFRDRHLMTQASGVALLEHYYRVAPRIVQGIDESSDAQSIYRRLYEDLVTKCVSFIQAGALKEAMQLYKETVSRLEREYSPSEGGAGRC